MAKPDNNYLKIAIAIVILAFVLRSVWALLIPVFPISDGEAYDQLARNLATHGIYGWSPTRPSAYWPPGTSAIYATLYLIFGQTYNPMVILNVILSTGIVALTMWVGSIFFEKPTAILAGFLMAIWPSEVLYVTILASETPFTFFVLLGCGIWFSDQLPKSQRAVAGALAFSAATYCRPIALLLPIVLWLSALPKWQKFRAEFLVMLATMVIIVVAVAPWSARNTTVFGHFVSMTTADGVNLWVGNNPNADGYYMFPPTVQGLSEYEQDQVLGTEARRYILDNPGRFLLLSLKKAVLLHLNETIAVTWNTEGITQRFGERTVFPLKVLTRGFWTGVLLLAIGGVIILVRTRGFIQTFLNPVVLIWIYFTAVYSVFFVTDRFHFPAHPFISVLAAVAILSCVSTVSASSIKARPKVGAQRL
jgi:4-amino-4-deoxy-L-arabinose transferase-like glycosyltransferase